MRIQIGLQEVAEAVRRYLNTPKADVYFTANVARQTLHELTAVVNDPKPQSSKSSVASDVAKSPDSDQ